MTDTVLRAEVHFESLREPVWFRFRGRNPTSSREVFDDAWQELWVREVERERAGRPSRAAAPVAFLAEAVHRIVIDDLRARARGIARADKAGLELTDLDDQAHVGDGTDVAADARYTAVVHKVLDLVRDTLTEREMRVFVASFLYLKSTPAAAVALGLSEPRVKKDRVKIAAKCGAAVWPLLAAELECSAGRAADLGAGFEVMADHVEDCAECAGLRHGALLVLGPVGLLAPGSGGWLDALTARIYGTAHRVSETIAAVPPAGRGAAVAGLVAAALAGGVATVDEPRASSRAVAPAATPARVIAPPVVTPTATPAARAPEPKKRRPVARSRTRPAPAATAEPSLRAPPVAPVAPSAPPGQQAAAAAPAEPTGEFGFERD